MNELTIKIPYEEADAFLIKSLQDSRERLFNTIKDLFLKESLSPYENEDLNYLIESLAPINRVLRDYMTGNEYEVMTKKSPLRP